MRPSAMRSSGMKSSRSRLKRCDQDVGSPRGQSGECYEKLNEKTGEKTSEKISEKVCETTGRTDGQGVHGGEHRGGALETKKNSRRQLAGDA
mmetsp:Transcript_171457/g.549571  ORF Transcript_171457/g.549571 Transcript_171457/m.549571 type:complete len:92 (+) Transcript_171457:3-278(+)